MPPSPGPRPAALVPSPRPPSRPPPTPLCTGGNEELQLYTSDTSHLRLESVGAGKKHLVLEARYNPTAPEGQVRHRCCCALRPGAAPAPVQRTALQPCRGCIVLGGRFGTPQGVLFGAIPCKAPSNRVQPRHSRLYPAALHECAHPHILALLRCARAGAQARAHRGPVQSNPRLGTVARLLVSAQLGCSGRSVTWPLTGAAPASRSCSVCEPGAHFPAANMGGTHLCVQDAARGRHQRV